MAFYLYRCDDGHETEGQFKMGEAPRDIACLSTCELRAKKVFIPLVTHTETGRKA